MEYTVEYTGDRTGIEAWLPSVSVTAAKEPQPNMEYTVEYTGNRTGIAAWLPSVSVTAAREHSQVWNTQWNTLVTEQELQLGFLQCLSLLPESTAKYGIHSGIHW